MWPEDVEGHQDWTCLTTLDHDPNVDPQVTPEHFDRHVEWDLNRHIKLPFDDDAFDEVHAYHVLEHLGAQGDFQFFFWQFSEFWRITKPGGSFCAIVPEPGSIWVWGDPGHVRVFHPALLTFLDQDEYTKQVGRTGLADYRRFYRADWRPVSMQTADDSFAFRLLCEKPSRISV